MSVKRSRANWQIHDRIISKLTKLLGNQGKYVKANPGVEIDPLRSVKRGNVLVYPDLVVISLVTGKSTELFEVETEDTVDSEEVWEWHLFNAGKEKFYLIVPEGSVERAKELIREKGFSIAGLGYYDSAHNISLPQGV